MYLKKIGIFLSTSVLVGASLSNAMTAQDNSQTDGVLLRLEQNTGSVRMLRSNTDTALTVRQQNSESIADAVKRNFAPHFGIKDPMNELAVKKEFTPAANRQTIRYQQQHQGIPVLAGELVANLKGQQLTSMSGEATNITLTDLSPDISATQASNIAIAAVAKWYGVDSSILVESKPELTIYDPALLTSSNAPQALTWKLTVSVNELSLIKEMVLIDANSGRIALHFNQIDTALNRATYTVDNTAIPLPGTLVCNESDPTCAAGDTDAQNAHRYAADTYNYYFLNHGRDSIDGNGMTIISTTHYPFPSPNAAWNGSQIIYSDGFSVADDVVAHELTHGVTDNTSELLYYYQSGAINESFSDIWGEFVDLTNTGGNDAVSLRWELGEDIPGIGTIRDMADPSRAPFFDPDRMTSGLYVTSSADNGGVHSNSGINNKAVTLMVDGGSFNGRTITGIGMTKVAVIYYDVQTNYLTSGSDYLDLYNALNQSCQNLIGSNGITANDCTQVLNATEAVEMNLSPTATYNPEAPICPAGFVTLTLFQDDLETNLLSWTSSNITGTNPWSRATGFATSGIYSVVAFGTATTHDNVLTLNNQVTLPGNGTFYLHFKHAFDFESSGGSNYDGGVIEYSTNNGASWLDAGGLINAGRQYTGTLATGNPLVGRTAFTSTSHGYNSSRLNLASLAGNNVRFRFRSTADVSIASLFWVVDDVRIYSCVPIGNSAPTADAGADQTVEASAFVTLDGTLSSDPDADSFIYEWSQLSGTTVTLSSTNSANPTFTSPAAMDVLVFQLRVTDAYGQVSNNDTVTLNVNAPINTGGGGGGGGGCSLNENGRFDPLWLALLLLLSVVHLSSSQTQVPCCREDSMPS